MQNQLINSKVHPMRGLHTEDIFHGDQSVSLYLIKNRPTLKRIRNGMCANPSAAGVIVEIIARIDRRIYRCCHRR